MSNIPSVASYIQVEANRFRSAVSESEETTKGGSINYCLDTLTSHASRLTALEGVNAGGPNVLKSSSSGTFNITPAFTDVTNMSVPFTKTKANSYTRITVESGIAGVTGESYIKVDNAGAGLQTAYVRLLRNGTDIAYQTFESNEAKFGPSSIMSFTDLTAGVGPFTYKLQALRIGGGGGASSVIKDAVLVVEEIKH